jgi:hypothetical protein
MIILNCNLEEPIYEDQNCSHSGPVSDLGIRSLQFSGGISGEFSYKVRC